MEEKAKRRRCLRFVTAFFLPLTAALLLAAAGFLRLFDRAWYDGLAHLAAARGKGGGAAPVIVAVDAAALRQYGRWPWRRARIALLLAKIAAGRPKAVGVDILLADPAEDGGELAAALRLAPTVLAGRLDLRRRGGVLLAGRPELPRPEFLSAAAGCGFVDFFPDADGVVRRMPVRLPRGPLPLSLAAALAATAGELPPGIPDEVLLSPVYLRPGKVVGAAEVLAGKVDPATWRGRVVLVGLTAPGAGDFFLSPLRALGFLPGVYLQACAYATIARRSYPREIPPGAAWAGFFLFSFFFFLLLRRTEGPWPAVWLYLFFTLFVLLLSAWSFLAARLYPAPSLLFCATGLMALGHLIGDALAAQRRAARLRRTFARFVAPEVLRQILAGPEPALGGETREATVLFADLRGFTRFAEDQPPEAAAARLNEHLALMARAVLAHGGMVDKFLGDAVMAVFGAPLDDPDHRRHALAAAEEIRAALARPGFLPVGIGLASGRVVAGNIGSPERLEYTAVGDAVNLAARLQEMAGPGEILAAESCFPEGPPAGWTALGPLRVKGKSLEVPVYRHP